MLITGERLRSVILDGLVQQRANLILWIPVFLGLGSCLYFGLNHEPGQALTLTLFLTAALLLGGVTWLTVRADDPNRHYILLLAASVLFWTVAGFSVAQTQARIVATPMLALDSKVTMVDGRIVQMETQENGRGWTVVLDQVRFERGEPETTPRKIRLTIRKAKAPFTLGDHVKVLAKLHATSAPVTPGAFDFQRFYYFQGIGALGFSLKPPQIIAKGAADDPGFILERLRGKVAAEINRVLPPREAGIAVALMTGERAAISEEDWTALRYSGLAHIISISGLHVALVAAPVFFVIRLLLAGIPFIALRWPIKKIAAAGALIACCAYVALVVPNVPTYRSLLMTGIGLIAIMLDRSPFSLRLVALAAAVVLILSPDSVWSASFQMSFAAVTALVAVADVMRPVWSRYIRNGGWSRKVVVYLAGAILTTFVASLATNPFSSFHFQQIASYSVIANGLCIPLTGLIIMPMLVLSFLLLPFGMADVPLQLMGRGITGMLDVATWVAALPGAVIHTPAWPQAALALFAIAGLCLILLVGRARLICVPLVIAGVVIIASAPQKAVMVAASGRLIMVNTAEQAFVSSRKREKFTLETWQKRIDVDQEQVVAWPKEGKALAGDVSVACDAEVCRITLPTLKISTGQSLYALQEDCDWADIMIVPGKKMKRCGKAKVYDIWGLRESGALAITESGKILTVRADQGDRPWSTWPKPYVPNDKSGSGTTVRPEFAPGRQ